MHFNFHFFISHHNPFLLTITAHYSFQSIILFTSRSIHPRSRFLHPLHLLSFPHLRFLLARCPALLAAPPPQSSATVWSPRDYPFLLATNLSTLCALRLSCFLCLDGLLLSGVCMWLGKAVCVTLPIYVFSYVPYFKHLFLYVV